ncbi:MAG TPA: hypothetical protein VE616_03845, partial [Candidatus Udaeobacter sp.]|nr:hypothetical protein [Candidatus Udaeobacter sp.]
MELADIGKTFRRLDYETKVTGKAQYLADMAVPGMCHGKILRSPLPHARIKRIDVSKAVTVSGVVTVITRDDILQDEGGYHTPRRQERRVLVMFIESAPRHVLDGLDDFLIATATAEVSHQVIFDLLFGRLRALVKQSLGRENEARG